MSSSSISSFELELDADMDTSSLSDQPLYKRDNDITHHSTTIDLENLLETTLSQIQDTTTTESTNGFMEDNDVQQIEEDVDMFDSDSDMSFCTSDDEQDLSDLDDLLNEGLPEDFRGVRSLKKTKDEILTLIRKGRVVDENLRMENEMSIEDDGGKEDGQYEELEESSQAGDNLELDRKATQSKSKQESFNYKEIIALEEKGKNSLEALPNGWLEVRHSSGMPLYLHRATRVCTWSKPYELGTGSARKHCIPVSSIPCLSYRRALDRENRCQQNSMDHSQEENSAQKQCDISSYDTFVKMQNGSLETELNSTIKECSTTLDAMLDVVSSPSAGTRLPISTVFSSVPVESEMFDVSSLCSEEARATYNKFNCSFKKTDKKVPALRIIPQTKTSSEALKNLLPCARVESAQENNTINSVQPIDFRTYCEGLFKFKHLKCMRFKTWSARRKHNKDTKRLQLQRPTLPDGVKLITFSVQNSGDSDGGKGNKEYIMNPQGKSSVCILHEYVQHALRMQPTYVFEELENATTPYLATVQISGVSYAVGYGSSKKQAKAAAAKATLELMIPEMKEQFNESKNTHNTESDQNEFFDQVSLDDPRITKMCANVSEPSPYALLLTCVQRNFGQSASSNIKFNMISSSNQSNKFRMETGEFSVDVTAANKRDGKQLASQALLAKIHPQIKNFSSFLRLYGNGSIKSVKEKKQEEQQITTLQSKASANSPNYAILNKLRQEMKKLGAQENSKKNLLEDDLNVSSRSSL